MERFREFVMRHFEIILVVVLVAATAFAVLVAANKVAFLNFFYVPTLIAAYFLGRNRGVAVSMLAVLMVSLYEVIDPNVFRGTLVEIPYLNVVLWGAFLILTSYLVGTLYDMKETNVRDLRQAYEGILEILAKYIDAVDRYTKEHSVRVAGLATRIAERLQLPDHEVENVRVAGLLHDVGKIEISLDVLQKASKLDDEEWEHIKTHPDKGTHMLRPVGGLLRDVIPLILCHHENFDGSGYHGMGGDRIPLGARILCVADAYDSMISDRPYRSGRTPREALQEVERCCGTQFDPQVVTAFLAVIEPEMEFV